LTKEVKIVDTEILSDSWYTLKRISFERRNNDGSVSREVREAYDRGNGAVILLYNKKNKSVILTRQFRLPTFINGNEDGMLIEACAGLLDKDNPEDCIKRETEEETGYRINAVQKVFEAYMSPGSVTEILYFFIGEYDETMKVNAGGGLEEENERIEVLELPFNKALNLMSNGGIKDAKTIMLLQYAHLSKLII